MCHVIADVSQGLDSAAKLASSATRLQLREVSWVNASAIGDLHWFRDEAV